MKKSKSISSGDRLSELPDSLIFYIFWLLPIRDVVRTTKLSKRWRNLWTISPFLNFSGYSEDGTLNRIGNFFNRALLLWRGVKLLKFKVMIELELTKALVSDINVWLRFAKEKGVEELCLDLQYDHYDDDYVDARLESLYSCSSLEVLSINDCSFSIGRNGNVKWDRLKSLTIEGDWVWDQDAITKVLCGSPMLEVFVLAHLERGQKCCIQSTSLKKLSIEKYAESESDDLFNNTELKIQTPNLETLQISGLPYSQLLVDHVQCLTDVTLGFFCLELCNHDEEGDEFLVLEKPMKQILPTIQHVQSLTLSKCCLEVLGVMNKKSLLSPFPKVMFLKLKDSKHVQSFSKHEQIVGLLQIFPNMERLAIEDDYDDEELSEDENEDDYQDDRLSLEFKANLPNSFLLQLGTVEVTWGASEKSIFLFIQNLLRYASKLEKMVFRVKRCSRPSYHLLFAASQKLLRMPRSSPTAQLIFRKY